MRMHYAYNTHSVILRVRKFASNVRSPFSSAIILVAPIHEAYAILREVRIIPRSARLRLFAQLNKSYKPNWTSWVLIKLQYGLPLPF